MTRFRAVAIAAVLGLVAVFPAINAPSAEAHGWVTDPPSRQDNCSTGNTDFDCGGVKYEPQSVEAPKGSMQCSGGNEAFAILDDESQNWPVKNVGSSATIQWKLTAAHNTSLWEYFVDGKLHKSYDQKGQQPASNITHTLTDLPAGKHTILARWNVSNTAMAFYNCIDINVGGTTNPDPDPTTDPTVDPTTEPTVDPTTEPGTCDATPWSSSKAYGSGDKVAFDGNEYSAKWWTQGDKPSDSGTWGVWTKLGPCGDDGNTPDPDPTTDPDPTVDPTVDPTTEPTTDPTEPGTCDGTPWSESTSYQSGDVVTLEGNSYSAKWWTLGENPATAGAWGAWKDLGPCEGTVDPDPDPTDPTDPDPTDPTDPDPTDPTDPDPTDDPTVNPNPGSDSARVVGYFTNWGIYQRDYQVKNIVESGSADKLTHILYAFGNVQNGKCTIGDSYADYEKSFTAEESVDGVADKWDDELRGNFNQLRKLKKINPDLKVLWSFGGWTWSGGFGDASKNAAAFAESCNDLVNDPRWDDVFDGIDIDWEYPNDCGLTCDTSGFSSYPEVLKALRAEFGTDLVTSATAADASVGGKLDKADYATAAQYLDFYMPMTYDYYGAFAKNGPTRPHSALEPFAGSDQGYTASETVAKFKAMGVPSDKIVLGIGFYGRGWTGVTDATPGGSATGAAAGSYEAGIEDYKVLKNTCPATGKVGGSSYAFCDGNWWSYDTPEDITNKMQFVKDENLGGAFFWELSGDTDDGELITAISNGLN